MDSFLYFPTGTSSDDLITANGSTVIKSSEENYSKPATVAVSGPSGSTYWYNAFSLTPTDSENAKCIARIMVIKNLQLKCTKVVSGYLPVITLASRTRYNTYGLNYLDTFYTFAPDNKVGTTSPIFPTLVVVAAKDSRDRTGIYGRYSVGRGSEACNGTIQVTAHITTYDLMIPTM